MLLLFRGNSIQYFKLLFTSLNYTIKNEMLQRSKRFGIATEYNFHSKRLYAILYLFMFIQAIHFVPYFHPEVEFSRLLQKQRNLLGKLQFKVTVHFYYLWLFEIIPCTNSPRLGKQRTFSNNTKLGIAWFGSVIPFVFLAIIA